MNDYTVRDKKNYGDPDVGKAAYPKFLEKLEVCRDLFHGFDYTSFLTGNDLEKARMISGGVNLLLGKSVAEHDLPDAEKTQTVYIKEALLLKQALSLCSSMVDAQTRFEAAYFEAVRTMLVRLTTDGAGKKFTLPEVNERINELLKHSIKSEGVINLFSNIGTEFSLFDPKFLEEVANMKEKNLAVELLKKLISEQVSVYRKTNLVKSQKFSEIIQSTMNRYLNGMLTNEEVIQELLKLAKEIADANAEGEKLGLTAEELAFYDALTKPQAIKDFMSPDRVVVGVESDRAQKLMAKLYRPFLLNNFRVIFMDVPSAEMTKYAANAMLATRISFMNDIANLCEIVGAMLIWYVKESVRMPV